MKWVLAATTLITLPVAVWYIRNDPSVSPKLAIYLACLPLLAALGIELIERLKIARDTPELYQEGSPIGNRIAVVLALALSLTVVLAVIYRVVSRAS